MYMRITRGQFDPAKFDALSQLAAEVNAAVTRLPGCRAMYQATDRARGTSVAVSIFDTEQHARFSREALGDIVQRTQAAGMRMETPEVFEVLDAVSQV